MKNPVVVSVLVALVGIGGALVARDARACGGCLHEPPPPNPPPNEVESVVTDHRMIFSISQTQTTLYDQIRYTGSPKSFAWVLPISGPVTIGLSSDAVFAALDDATATTIGAPAPPSCPPPPPAPYCPDSYCPSRYCPNDYNSYGSGDDGGTSSDSSYGGGYDDSASADSAPPPVTVTMQETVGPYETVQLHSTDPNALTDWLTSHGYVIPSDVAAIISAYVAENFDFLAMKLVPGAGVQAMRPVRVTWPGATNALPLRMVAAGTGATVGVTMWIIGDGRYEPQNFPTFTVSASELVWDYSIEESNYTTLRAKKEALLGGRGWQIESSAVGPLVDAIAAIDSVSASLFYDAVKDADGGVVESSDQVRTDDIAALSGGDIYRARVTRVRSDLAHAALASDLVLEASLDQSSLSRNLYVTSTKNAPPCPTYPPPGACPPKPTSCPPVAPCNSDSGGVFGSCAATASPIGSPEALGSLVVLGIVVGFRMRRRRRAR
jgi:hypothetical protein